jgi:uncharacterized repeat protein (TIGR01451 family)
MSSYPHHLFSLIRGGGCATIQVRGIVMNTIELNTPVTNCVSFITSTPVATSVPLDSNCADIIVRGTDIAVHKTASADTVRPGDMVAYTIAVDNLGRVPGSNIVVSDRLPSQVTLVNWAASCPGAIYDPPSGRFTIPSLAPGARCVLILSCTLNGDVKAPFANCADLIGVDETDLDLTNNHSCATVNPGICSELPRVGPLDFGEIGWCGDSLVDVVLRNPCSSARELRAIIPPASGVFELASGSLPMTLGASGSTTIRVTFRPGATGSWIDSIRYVVVTKDGAGEKIDTLVQPLRGAGVGLHAVAEIAQGYRAFPGHPVRTAVTLLHALDMVHVRRLMISVAYDTGCVRLDNGDSAASLLAGGLLEGWRVESITNERGRLVVVVSSPADSIYLRGTGMLLNPEIEIFMAKALSSDLRLSVDIPDAPCVGMESLSGWIRLDSVCGLDLRLIERVTGSKLAIDAARPNPFSDYVDIRFSTIFDAPVRLTVTDASGRTVATLADEPMTGGEHELRWDARTLSSGLYYLRLKSDDRTVTERLILVK